MTDVAFLLSRRILEHLLEGSPLFFPFPGVRQFFSSIGENYSTEVGSDESRDLDTIVISHCFRFEA